MVEKRRLPVVSMTPNFINTGRISLSLWNSSPRQVVTWIHFAPWCCNTCCEWSSSGTATLGHIDCSQGVAYLENDKYWLSLQPSVKTHAPKHTETQVVACCNKLSGQERLTEQPSIFRNITGRGTVSWAAVWYTLNGRETVNWTTVCCDLSGTGS